MPPFLMIMDERGNTEAPAESPQCVCIYMEIWICGNVTESSLGRHGQLWHRFRGSLDSSTVCIHLREQLT